jgi:hypothetical protein
MHLQKTIVCGFLIFVGIAAMMSPVFRYLDLGWRAKRKDIMDGLDSDSRLAYFGMFSGAEVTPDANTASLEFERLYSKWYGRQFFLVPTLLLFLVTLIAVSFVVLTVLDDRGYLANPLFDMPGIGIAAMAGAYMWVVNDFISRARRLDFAPSDILWGVLRLIIAIPMGYAFASIAKEPVGEFIAFAIGAFPLTALTSMLRRLANKNLGLEGTPEESCDDIIKLQGINRTIVERLFNEDVTTITQIAFCDPVQLTMRSNLSFYFVTDCMNQALAWMYLQGDLDKIRPLGVRGAIEIKHLISALDDTASTDPMRQGEHARAVAAMPKIANAIRQDPDTLQIAFREIAGDPYTTFLDRVYN